MIFVILYALVFGGLALIAVSLLFAAYHVYRLLLHMEPEGRTVTGLVRALPYSGTELLRSGGRAYRTKLFMDVSFILLGIFAVILGLTLAASVSGALAYG